MSLFLRVTSPLVVLRESPRHDFLTIEPGMTIETHHQAIEFGLVAIRIGSNEYWAFARDLRECCSAPRADSPVP